MPSPTPSITAADVPAIIADRCASRDEDRVGLELEWLTYPMDDPGRRLTREVLEEALAGLALPAGARVTLEPGGQVELSSAPSADLARLHEALDVGRWAIADALRRAGIGVLSVAHDPLRPPACLDLGPRYRAMASFLGRRSPAGPAMMANTVSVQVNVDLGTGARARRRWHLAHLLGPVLTATFANSPFAAGRPSGWRSTRMALWGRIDRSRCRPARRAGDPVGDWTAFARSAQVMLVRCSPERFVGVEEPLTLDEWVSRGHALGYPDADDVAYHLTTLFPPVRLRGWLELRTIDALPDPWWRVASAVVTAALRDPVAGESVRRACAATAGLEEVAARRGLDHPLLAEASARCLDATIAALGRLNADGHTTEACLAYRDQYVARRRTPADSLLAAYAADGSVGVPEPAVLLGPA